MNANQQNSKKDYTAATAASLPQQSGGYSMSASAYCQDATAAAQTFNPAATYDEASALLDGQNIDHRIMNAVASDADTALHTLGELTKARLCAAIDRLCNQPITRTPDTRGDHEAIRTLLMSATAFTCAWLSQASSFERFYGNRARVENLQVMLSYTQRAASALSAAFVLPWGKTGS